MSDLPSKCAATRVLYCSLIIILLEIHYISTSMHILYTDSNHFHLRPLYAHHVMMDAFSN